MFVNNKGAKSNPDVLANLVAKDVNHGYAMAWPLSKSLTIPSILLASMNIMHQKTINESGQIIEKERLTHNQSYEFGSKTSVNSRVRSEELMPCMYGAFMKRLVNCACSARQKYPNTLIYASKVDFKSAYQQCQLSATTEVQSCTQLSLPNNENALLIMYLWLTFGGAPGPNEWSILAKPICNLATALIQDGNWDPSVIKACSQN